MPALAETSLTSDERAIVAGLIDALRARLGDDLRSVWLFGSRARGEEPGPESDVDLLILSEGGSRVDGPIVNEVIWELAWSAGLNPFAFTTIVWDPDRLDRRREIHSFFVQEVDRDKVVLYGDP
ncbi:MAG: nucleotidyltransferase family protein [Solirubrobacterales bacterium]